MKCEWKSSIKIAAVLFLLYVCIYYWPNVANFISLFIKTLSPIFAGFSIAYVLNILMSFYERHYFTKYSEKAFVKKTRIPVCVVASIVTFLAISVAIVMLIIPELISCIKFIVGQIPPFVESLVQNDHIAKIVPDDIISSLKSVNWQDIVSKVAQFVATGVTTAAGAIFNALSSVVSVLVTIFISVIFSVYFMLSKNTLASQAKRVLHTFFGRYEKKVIYITGVVNDCFHKFIVGQCLEAVVLWIMCTIGMMIFRFPYAQMISAFVAFTALIPIAGPYIGAMVGAIMIMTVSPIKALLFIVFIIVLQQIEGNFIYPKVVGRSIGLPAVWVLAGITIGGGLMGILGMIIGVPIVATVYRLVKERVENKEKDETEQKLKNQKDKKREQNN